MVQGSEIILKVNQVVFVKDFVSRALGDRKGYTGLVVIKEILDNFNGEIARVYFPNEKPYLLYEKEVDYTTDYIVEDEKLIELLKCPDIEIRILGFGIIEEKYELWKEEEEKLKDGCIKRC